MAKNLPAMLETWVRSLDQEDPLEKVMARTEEPGQRNLVGYSPWDREELDTTEQLTLSDLSQTGLILLGGCVTFTLRILNFSWKDAILKSAWRVQGNPVLALGHAVTSTL